MKRLILLLLIVCIVLADIPPLPYFTTRQEVPRPEGQPSNGSLPVKILRLVQSPFLQQLVVADWQQLWGLPQQLILDPLELIPQDTLLMIDAADLTSGIKGFLNSRFGTILTSTNWSVILRDLEVKKGIRDPLERNCSALMKLIKNPLLQNFFSRRAVLALLPPNLPSDTLAEQLVLFLSPPGNSSLSDLPALLRLKGKEIEVVHYHGIPVYLLKPGQDAYSTLYLTSLGGKLVVSLGPQPIQRSIDLFLTHFLQKQTGLLLTADYQALRDHGEADFFLYADAARVKSLFWPAAGEEQAVGQGVGIRSMALLHHQGTNPDRFTAVVRYSPYHLQSLQRKIYTTYPIRNHTLQKMPSALLFYLWSNWADPEPWHDYLISGDKEDLASAGRVAAWFREQTGMGIKEFTGLFGQEFSLNIHEISTAGFFPIPRLCLLVEIRDRAKVEQFFDKILSGLPVRRSRVNGTPVISLMAAQGMMQPSYAFADGFLLLADSREQVTDILTNGPRRLVEDPVFRAVDTDMADPSNLQFFARTAKLVHGMKELASWGGTMIAIRNQEVGAKSKILVDRVISPLLDGVSMYEAIGMRSYTRPGELIVDALVLRADPEKEQPGKREENHH